MEKTRHGVQTLCETGLHAHEQTFTHDERGVVFRNLGLLVVTTCKQELEYQAENETRSNPVHWLSLWVSV
jgi:hypothetical protein